MYFKDLINQIAIICGQIIKFQLITNSSKTNLQIVDQ
jgi:hypothetical protein